MRTFTQRHALLPLIATALAAAANPGAVQAQGFFDAGKTRVSASIGAGRAFNDSYVVAGLGVGHFIRDGIELGLDAKAWTGGAYDVYDVSPSATYVFTQLDNFKPYAGLLYRKTFIEGFDDLSAYGGRAGVFSGYSSNLLLRIGVVGVRYQNCNEMIYSDCSEIYPEVAASFFF